MLRPSDQTPSHCRLEHAVFLQIGEPSFRRAETDGTPVMVVQLGDREAALPLRSLQREFAIESDSPDGRMLGLIAASLDFVTSLRLGDALPAEVLTGEASWEPTAQHLRLAKAKLQLQLVAWLRAGTPDDQSALDAAALLAAAEDPAMRHQVQEAFGKAAASLGLAAAAAVVALIEGLAQELAYIEALRERLLQPVQGLVSRLTRIAHGWRGDASQLELLTQVRRLSVAAARQIGHRFDEVDAQTGEVIAALRNLDSQRAFIRTQRDWLYRTLRAWQPVLLEWDTASFHFDEHTRPALERTYRFLAPRFMPVTEWLAVNRPGKRPDGGQKRGMVW
jgi:hypothetical protein